MTYLTRREIAARYRQSIRTIDNWKHTFLPHIKIGGKVLFDIEECDAAVRKFTRRPRLGSPNEGSQRGEVHGV